MSIGIANHFFFFYCLYNPGWVLVCSTILFHSCLSSTFALQPTTFILFRSSSIWSIHLNLGLPTGLVLYGIHSVIFLVVLVFSILIKLITSVPTMIPSKSFLIDTHIHSTKIFITNRTCGTPLTENGSSMFF